MKTKIGVIGAGHLGRFHIKNLLEIHTSDFVGFFELNEERAKEISSEFGIKHFSNFEEFIENVEAVSIVTNTVYHYEIAKKCLLAGKHVFIEKPITAKISEAEELVEIAGKNKLLIQVGHIERFNPAVLSLKNYELNPAFIQSERLAPFNPRGADVSVIQDLMIHDIDLILSLIKSEVSDIRASGVALVSNSIDIANARIEFENGAVANVTASRISQKRMRKMRIFQKDAYVVIDFNQGLSEIISLASPDDKLNPEAICYGEIGLEDKKKLVIFEQPPKVEVNAMKKELELFIDAVQTGKMPVVTGEDGLKAIKVAETIINKIEESLEKYGKK